MPGPAAPLLNPADTTLEPGDRFELSLPPDVPRSGRWRVPETLRAAGVRVQVVEDPQGKPLAAVIGPDTTDLVVPDSARLLPPQCDAAWLEYRAPGRFRLLFDEGPAPDPDA